MKFDKDQLMKHRFWIMISVAGILILLGIFYLQFAVEADTTKLKGPLGAKTSADHNRKTIDAHQEYVIKGKDSESKVWAEAYNVQKDIFRWGPKFEREFPFHDGLFATQVKLDKLPESVKDWPKDNKETMPYTMHGVLTHVAPEFFEIKDSSDKTVRFYRTVSCSQVEVVPDGSVAFPQMFRHTGKLAIVTYQQGKYFADVLTTTEQRAFAENYANEVLEVLKMVDPLDEKGNGVVQLKDWLYKPELPATEAPFVRFVPEWNFQKLDISKEAWIAQEDLWIQHEIYRLIAATNDSVGKYERVKTDPKKTDVHTFRNTTFEINLKLDAKKELQFEIKNRTQRRQRLDIRFRVKMNKGLQPEIITISGNPLMPAGTKNDTLVQTIPAGESLRTEIVSVEQVLAWDTAAVKRIDYISIGSNDGASISHSHRTFPEGLKPLDSKDAEVAQKPDDKMVGKDQPYKFEKGGTIGGAGGNKKVLDHKLWTDRYMEVTEQSRRVPVAIALIIDQEHVDRVLTQFNNSKLRFLLTQVMINQYTGNLQPQLMEDKKQEYGPKLPYSGQFPRPGTFPMPTPMPTPTPMPGPGPGYPPTGGGLGQGNEGGSITETNLEIVIYGVMTLYQRYPPRPAGASGEKK